MEFVCRKSSLCGGVDIPASKSHTIRALAIATMAQGESRIEWPLDSGDTVSAYRAMAGLGARLSISDGGTVWKVDGVRGEPRPTVDTIDVGNSGTTLRILMGMAALSRHGRLRLDGDAQIRRRPAGPLAAALNDLGATVVSEPGNGCAPFSVGGVLRGGSTRIDAPTSQYVTSLLLAAPLACGDTTLEIGLLNERPYVDMTIDWLTSQQIRFERDGFRRFHVHGGQGYRAFTRRIPADFSSATFFLVAGAIGANRVTCRGLDLGDSQADKAVIDYLETMGATVIRDGCGVTVGGGTLRGMELDLNETPDALPAMAVLGCFAAGETRLRNVAHARIKETDRIAVMTAELRALGADVDELPDGMIIRESALHGGRVSGHDDHRVVMALAVAGLASAGVTVVTGAEAARVTFPEFAALTRALGGDLRIDDPASPDGAVNPAA